VTPTLVTGATGFLGTPCSAQLAGIDLHTCARRAPAEVRGSFHVVDMLDHDATRALIAEVRPRRLLHLAWTAAPGTYWESPENDDWLEASRRLLRSFVDFGGERAVVAGSCAEYDWSMPGPYREHESPLRPASRYGQAKAALGRWTADCTASVAWARLFFLYGPGEHETRLVPSVANALLEGREAELTPGTQVRDFLHVQDAARALVALLDDSVTGPVNIGSGRGVTVRSVAERVGALAGRPDLLRFGARPAPTAEDVVADVRRLRDEVGWQPTRTLEDGLEETVDWWRDHARAG
jgi:nucleoside-diphosphate-sugar epimerase